MRQGRQACVFALREKLVSSVFKSAVRDLVCQNTTGCCTDFFCLSMHVHPDLDTYFSKIWISTTANQRLCVARDNFLCVQKDY